MVDVSTSNLPTAERQGVIEQIYTKIPYLNPALHRIGEYILGHPDEAKTMTINQLASACEVSESTVTRFVREIGLRSYQDLKLGLAEALSWGGAPSAPADKDYLYEGLAPSDPISTVVEKVLYQRVQTLVETKKRLNLAEVERAVGAIEAAHVLIFSCLGSSSLAAEEGVMRFSRAGKKCVLYRDSNLQLITSAILKPEDVMIAISNSGRSKSVVEAVRLARSRGAKTIAITACEDAPLMRYAEIGLFTPPQYASQGSGLQWDPTTSKSAQMLVIEILYACFAVRHLDETVQHLDETFEALRETRYR